MILGKFILAITDRARTIKLNVMGKYDPRVAIECSPFGVDANPIKGMTALYAETAGNGKRVVIGYIGKNQLAQPGEHRTYSLDSNGNVKFYIWEKSDGTCEIGGNTKHMTRFEELETGFNQLRADFNAHITNYDAHVHLIAPYAVIPGPAIPTAPTATPGMPSTADISGAKIEQIKTL